MIRVVRDLASIKNGKICGDKHILHFVDERDFKEVSVVGKRKSKKNRAVGFVLTDVSAESSREDRHDEVESGCSSEIGSSSTQPDENSDESTKEGSCSPEEFSENLEASKTFVHNKP